MVSSPMWRPWTLAKMCSWEAAEAAQRFTMVPVGVRAQDWEGQRVQPRRWMWVQDV